MIYLLAALLPPIGLLLNGQPFSAILNLVLLVFCMVFGLFFHVLLLVPWAHAAAIGKWWRRFANMACRRAIRADPADPGSAMKRLWLVL
jgi:hypothetical protein